ncbi:NAD-dependent protein deacetylase sirtuin-7 [Pelomyxa schiedti]|nr:NAD-dependent protein deacetylase sirtuin-7 [Pelomyxa schiedti]
MAGIDFNELRRRATGAVASNASRANRKYTGPHLNLNLDNSASRTARDELMLFSRVSENSVVTVDGAAVKVICENCADSKFTIRCVITTKSMEIIKCSACEITVSTDVPTITVSNSKNITLHLLEQWNSGRHPSVISLVSCTQTKVYYEGKEYCPVDDEEGAVVGKVIGGNLAFEKGAIDGERRLDVKPKGPTPTPIIDTPSPANTSPPPPPPPPPTKGKAAKTGKATTLTPEMERLTGDWKEAHGFGGHPSWVTPKMVTFDPSAARSDHGNSLPRHEYLDEQSVLEEKVLRLAEYVKRSKFCVAYTGAGLSKSAGISDYATKNLSSVSNTSVTVSSMYEARPSLSHHVLAAMEKAGYLKHFVQQNHDGLPQKAGFPQEKMNEIHGGIYDPSNPVVQFGSNLRADLFTSLSRTEVSADLCLCLGTSLSGMNADRQASTPAEKSLMYPPKAIGTVIINLQQTPLDSKSVLRIWSRLDDALRLLATALGITTVPPASSLSEFPPGDIFSGLPYDPHTGIHNHKLVEYTASTSATTPTGVVESETPLPTTTLNLSKGSHVVIVHPNASNRGAEGVVRGVDSQSHWLIQFECGTYVFGRWWVDSAQRGAIPFLPLVNKQS